MNIVYSFNKKGYEARFWEAEIRAASTDTFTFIPFNHQPYLEPARYLRAQLLDNLYYEQHPALMRLYDDLEAVLRQSNAVALVVDNCPPYHPDYLRKIDVYKVLRINDGPISAYDRDFAYLHAYDHILYHGPGYSRDLTMPEKLRYCGARTIDFWPLALFDAAFDATKSEHDLLGQERDIDIVFIGGQHVGKLPLLAKVKQAFGSRFRLHGLSTIKTNLYFNLRYRFPGWVRPIPAEQYVPLYQRTKIGINIHNRGKYTVGNYRLFELPANGVLQISDGGEYLSEYFRVGEEIIAYEDADDLIDKLHYYLEHEEERRAVALRGYRRVMKDHRFAYRMTQLGELVERGMRELAVRSPKRQRR